MQSQRPEQSDGVQKRSSVIIIKRKNRHPKTPPRQKIPGMEISDLTTEKLEYLVSLDLSKDPSAKEWKIKAAHELAARYIEGDASPSNHKAPHDHVKAHTYAQMEINTLSIEEIEIKFFNLDSSNTAKIMPWQSFSHTVRKINRPIPGERKHIQTIFFNNAKSIDEFITNSHWNEEINEDKAIDANAVILAWEKQLAAVRLAEHYRKLKKEKRDIHSALAARFYKQAAKYFAAHEPPSNWLTTALLKMISPRFNSIRLFIIRLNKFLTQLNAPLLATPFLKWIATIAGLYFLAELLVDLKVLGSAWLYNAAGELNPSWERLTLALWEDNRISRMANAAVWFAINFTCLMLTLFLIPVAPLLAPLLIGGLTIAGCVFDLGAEVAIGAYGFKTIKELLTPILAELAKLEDVDTTKKFTDLETSRDPEGVAAQKQKITQKLSLLEIREQLIKKRTALEINRAYTVGIMAILTVTAIFIFFPFAALPLAPLIATITALVVGSVFGGLGKYLFWNAPEFYKSGKELASKGIRSVKELFVGKTKQPFTTNNHHADDFHVNTTQLLHDSLKSTQANTSRTTLNATANTDTHTMKNYELHRNLSGTLFSADEVIAKSTKQQRHTTTQPLARKV